MQVLPGLTVAAVLNPGGAALAGGRAAPGVEGLGRSLTGHPTEALALCGIGVAVKAARLGRPGQRDS